MMGEVRQSIEMIDVLQALHSRRNLRPTRAFALGTIVAPTGLTVLERDGELTSYTDAGVRGVTLVPADALLLVIGCLGDELRVMHLETGMLGRLNAGAVAEYK